MKLAELIASDKDSKNINYVGDDLRFKGGMAGKVRENGPKARSFFVMNIWKWPKFQLIPLLSIVRQLTAILSHFRIL